MTLDDLRAQLEALAHLPGDTLVVLAKDGLGKTYSPLAEVQRALYAAGPTGRGERYVTIGAPAAAVAALFLWPVN